MMQGTAIAQAKYPTPFTLGLEYSAPARGPWNIVHIGMLIPQAHQIFVCAQGCLRGVVLTAAEMGAQERFSTIAVRENNVLNGDMEELILNGTADIIAKLPSKPPAVLLYTSCIHHFMGCDLPYVYRKLAERFPDIKFTDCYMDPIMRKSGLNPDQTMRRQLYSLLEPLPKDAKTIHLAGCCFPIDRTSELYSILVNNGFTLRELPSCRNYDEYMQLAQSSYCLTLLPAAKPAGQFLAAHLGQQHLYLPFSFDYEQITATLATLCDSLSIATPDFTKHISECEEALGKARNLIGDTPIVLDYTAFPRLLSLARLLLKHGFIVAGVYADSFGDDEKEDFAALQESDPDLLLYPTTHSMMRIFPRQSEVKRLAIGQKAAYFTGTKHMVNIVEGGGMYGFSGIVKLAHLMTEAFLNPQDTRRLIQIKGIGCSTCL